MEFDKNILALAPPRPLDANKATFGKLLCVGGSRYMPGAAMLMCRAASRSGAGLVLAALPECILPVFQSERPECVTVPLENLNLTEQNYTAAAVGPGFGKGDAAKNFVFEFLKTNNKPFVLDADGLNIVSENLAAFTARKTCPCVITPHPGEMSRLTDLPVSDITRDISGVARKFAEYYNAVVVLKDPHTVVASPDGDFYINQTGNPGMAKGGSGDVLTGVIGSFLAQGLSAFDAAVLGVYVHGAAGNLAAQKFGQFGILPQEIADEVAQVLRHCDERGEEAIQGRDFHAYKRFV